MFERRAQKPHSHFLLCFVYITINLGIVFVLKDFFPLPPLPFVCNRDDIVTFQSERTSMGNRFQTVSTMQFFFLFIDKESKIRSQEIELRELER